jgi:flagellar basal-body rod protein FlgB
MLEAIDLFRLAGDRLRYLTGRQSVIARNIANADTPGYVAQDTAPFSFASAVLRNAGTGGTALPPAAPLALAATEPGHFSTPPGTEAPVRTMPAKGYGAKPDGNTVSLDEQMLKQADVANSYALASAAYAKNITLMKLGIDIGN